MSLFSTISKNLSRNKTLLSVFLLCIAYWIYLVCFSEMIIVFDAIGYEQLGTLVYQHGWAEYFRTGPHREPFYPGMIAGSMKIAEIFSTSYPVVQKWMQAGFLFITQILLFVLLSKLKIRKSIKFATLLYFGISPALVNSAFSLYSEIATFPFVLAAALMCALSWKTVHNGRLSEVIFAALLTTFSFLLLVATKSAFMYVFVVCLFPFGCVALYLFGTQNFKRAFNAGLYVLISLCLFSACIFSYMNLNKIHNGHFQINDRNTDILLGSAMKRSKPLTRRGVMVHLSSIPGTKVCQKFFNTDECREADWYGSYKPVEIQELLLGVAQEDQNLKIVQLTFDRIREHPFQYVFFMFIEGAKMPFWESTQVGYVDYPPLLTKLFNNVVFKNGLRLGVSLLTIFALFYLLISLFKDRLLIFDLNTFFKSINDFLIV